MSSEPSNTPFFVVGAPRSGTTLLRLMLNSHPRLAIPVESHFLIPLFAQVRNRGKLSAEERSEVTRIIRESPRWKTWNVGDERLQAIAADPANDTLRRICDGLFAVQTAATGKPRWGDKTPENTLALSDIGEVYPEACTIHIVRDGRDVWQSLRAKGWYGWTDYQWSRLWLEYAMAAETFGEGRGAGRFLRVRYEDLVLESERELRRICAFLGEDFAPEMLRFHESASRNITDSEKSGGVHDKLNRPPSASDIYRWKHEVDPEKIYQIELAIGHGLDRFDYERHWTGNPGWGRRVRGWFYLARGTVLAGLYTGYHRWFPRSLRLALANSSFKHRIRALFKG